MAYLTEEIMGLLKVTINSVLDVVYQYEEDLMYIGYIEDIASGPLKGQLLICFKSKIPELAEISQISFSAEKIVEAIGVALKEDGKYDTQLLLGIQNNIAKSILKKINEEVKPALSKSRYSINDNDVQNIRSLFKPSKPSVSERLYYDKGTTFIMHIDAFCINPEPTPNIRKLEIIKNILRLIWDNIRFYENDIQITTFLYEDNGNQLWGFKPTDYDNIKCFIIDPEPYLERLENVIDSNAFEETLLQVVNQVANHILNNYISAIKEAVISDAGYCSSAVSRKKSFHNKYDNDLICFIKLVFSKCLNMDTSEIYSIDLGNNCFEIHASTTTDIHLKMFYILRNSKAQLQLESIVIPPYNRGKGISKLIINNLYKFCSETENTELLITDVINENWELYLRAKGALLVKKDDEHGDILKIQDYIT